ncbi:MAG: PAS-domain containing protein [Alphaproteobacteria bacterium]|nr:PAS-domain containing protein [Alphaproteobacteria bacterium]
MRSGKSKVTRFEMQSIGAGAVPALLAAVPGPLVLIERADGRPLGATAEADALFGRAPEDATHPLWRSAWFDPQQRTAFFALIEAQESVAGFEAALIRADGGIGRYAIAAKPVTVAGHAAVAMNLSDLARRTEVETLLRTSEARLKDLVEGAAVGIVVVSLAEPPVALYANQSAARLLGRRSPQNLLSLTSFDLAAGEEDRARLAALRAERRDSGAPGTYRFRAAPVAGEAQPLQIEVRARPIDWHGIAAEQLVLIDASGAAAEEAAVKDRTAVLEVVIENMAQGLLVADGDLRIIQFNSTYRRDFRMPDEWKAGELTYRELLEHTRNRDLYPDDERWRERVAELMALALDTRPNDYEVQGRDGRIFQVHSLPRPGGGWIRTYTNVTERRYAEAEAKARAKELAEKTAILQATMETMDQGLLVTDPDLAVAAFNRKFVEQFELPKEMVERPFSFADVVKLRAERGELGEGETASRTIEALLQRARGGHAQRTEVARPDGKVLEMRSQPRANGGFVRTYTDISERKRVEAELRESQQRLQSILNTCPVAVEIVALVDGLPTGDILFHNPRMGELLGVEPGMPGQSYSIDRYVDPVDQDRLLARMAEAGNFQDEEIQLARRDGSSIWVLASGWPLLYLNRSALICWYYDITERKRVEAALIEAATVDGLSGAYNRAHFLQRAEQELRKNVRYGRPMSLLSVDIDHFKKVNDTFGHAVGDDAIRIVSAVCRKTLRDVDIFGRLGGEEFAAVLPETPVERALEAAERVRKAVSLALVPHDAGHHQITTSIGVATISGPDETLTALLKRADDALYAAKRNGRNRVERG